MGRSNTAPCSCNCSISARSSAVRAASTEGQAAFQPRGERQQMISLGIGQGELLAI